MTGGRIVILGATGRNFAAGMSGGIAYVYDVKQQFATLCNKEMVDLDPLDAEDAQALNDMITRHYAYTGSAVARFVLDDFENQLKNFIKVFPKDYKKALQEKSKVKQGAKKK
jgi:glutamate synthase (NADPH/NADH) large chain